MNGSASGGGHDDWIGIEDAAGYLAIPVRTLYRLAQRGQVPASKVGRTWRFKRSILDEHLATAAYRSAGARRSSKPPGHASEPSTTSIRAACRRPAQTSSWAAGRASGSAPPPR